LKSGEVRLRVVGTGDRTLSASIRAIIEDVTSPSPKLLKVRGESFAKVTVAPTLAAATIGLMTNDVGTANAILRADYASGPGMTAPLGLLQDTAEALRLGIIATNSQLFAKLASVTVLLIDDDGVAWPRSSDVGWPRSKHRPLIGVLTCSTQCDAGRLARRLGIDFAQGNLSPQQKVEMIQNCQQRGERVAFVGNSRRCEEMARYADVTIALDPPLSPENVALDALLLNGDLSSLPRLWQIANRQRQRSWRQAACTVIPNLLCVAGAFALGFTGLHTVLLSNLGTLTVYRSAGRWLRDQPGNARQANHPPHGAPRPRRDSSRIAWGGLRK
jgi:cation transport ATPase